MKPAFVSRAGAAGAAAVSQTLPHPRKRRAEAPQGWGEHRQPCAPARLLGLPFPPSPDGRSINIWSNCCLCFAVMMILQWKGSGEWALEY